MLSTARRPPAPGRLSTIWGWPAAASRVASTRATTSAVLPGGKPTHTRTALPAGYAHARQASCEPNAAAAAPRTCRRLITATMLFGRARGGNLGNRLSDIHRMHIDKLDLNLLRVFDAVYRTRSVSRASDDLGLSQPATSQAIARLRLVLKDALFVRVQGGVEPTPKAQRLAEAVRHSISTLESALLEAEEFDPRSAPRTFRLHLTDTGEALFLPRLITALARAAPGIGLHSFAVPQEEIG